MSNIVPFSATGEVPANITGRQRTLDVNKDIVTAAPYPTLSIEGKMFTIVQDSERKVLTKPDDPEEVIQSINVAALRINMHAKTYYAKAYSVDDSAGQMPDCYSLDGKTPSANVENPQAEKCAVCPYNVFGSRISEDGAGKGKACSDKPRMAVADPAHLDKPMLLRVPPASIKPLKEALKAVKQRGIQYNETVFRIGFDREAPSPKLTFKPVGVLDDASYAKACELFESEVVRGIVGADDYISPALPAPEAAPADELDAAMKAREATRKAAEKAKPEAPKEEPEEAPAAKATRGRKKTAEPTPEETSSMLGDLDDLLGKMDD